jgi:hypothetical protein
VKPLLLAAALLSLPAAASAQVAAGTVPNTFDKPAQGAPAQAAPARPAASTPAESLTTTPANAASEETLRDFIAAVQTDQIDYAVFTDDLAGKVREQAPQITPLIKGFGAVQAVDFVGARDGVDLYAVTFAAAETQWMIGFNEAGKVAALLFRPAEAASSGS